MGQITELRDWAYKSARISYEWAGDRRAFCSGLVDASNDEVFPECRGCVAWAGNARPSEELKKQWGKE